MGRELQKKKNRSSIGKVRQKPRSKKRVNPRSNPIIAANWDSKLTLAQNYRQLGLTSKLNPRAGGVEKSLANAEHESSSSMNLQDSLALNNAKTKTPKATEAQVERDPKTGDILRVIYTNQTKSNPLNDPLNDLSDDEDVAGNASGATRGSSAVVKALEEQASMEIKPRSRQQSTREGEWIERLIEKYGDDYGKMSRDRKLNPYQQTENDISRRVKKWKERHRS